MEPAVANAHKDRWAYVRTDARKVRVNIVVCRLIPEKGPRESSSSRVFDDLYLSTWQLVVKDKKDKYYETKAAAREGRRRWRVRRV